MARVSEAASSRPQYQLARGNGFEAMVRESVGCAHPLHEHDTIQVVVPSVGPRYDAVWHEASGRTDRRACGGGDACITPAGQPHTIEWAQRGGFVAWKLAPELVADACDGDVDPRRVEVIPRYGAEDPLLAEIGRHVRRELASGAAQSAELESFAIAAARRLATHHTTRGGARSQRPGRLSAAQLERVTEYVHAHLDQPLSLADLARVAGLGRFGFARAFRAVRGMPPHQYVLRARVERARTLLRTTEERIDRIALRSGFSHQSHLTRTYRRLLGTTPARERAGR